jgi:hypothetical protein
MRKRSRLIPPLALIAALALWLAAPGPAVAGPTQISSFQDDIHLIDSPTPTVVATLQKLSQLGVQQIRVNVEWWSIAPNPLSLKMPAGFQDKNPAAYPAGNWAPYDRLVWLASLYHIALQFNLTSPAPLWAVARNAPTTRAANHWEPNPTLFADFVYAVGSRYSGAPYGQGRVSNWSIWNEPNQPGWLAPQWLKVGGHEVPQSPRLYRQLADAAYDGLYFSGHAQDTILFGETAPEGHDSPAHQSTPDFYTAMTPIPFLRDLYCLSGRYRPLQGSAAQALGCPASGSAAAFVQANPVLFEATGFAHHPYDFKHSPTYNWPDPNGAPLADLGRLERFLNRALSAYGVHRSLPIYFTEYGYETNPPDPHQVVSPAQQAAYLNESDYLAWRDPRVLSVAQYELYDAAPDPRYRPSQFDYWDTFQMGLLFHNGAPKPSYAAYRMEIWLPHPSFARGQKTFIWGLARATDRQTSAQPIAIRWRAASGGPWRTIAVVDASAGYGYLTDSVRLPGSGQVKLVWFAKSGGFQSRTVTVTER